MRSAILIAEPRFVVIQTSELINLIGDLVSLPILIIVLRNRNLPRYRLFLAALGTIILSHIFTIVEGFIWPVLLNAAEHLSLLAASVLFLVGALRYFRPQRV